MMNWSETVLSMVDEGEGYENIIAHFNSPVVTEEYIKNAVDSRYRLTRKRWENEATIRQNVPTPGTGLRVVYDYMLQHGGRENFFQYAKKETTLSAIARELKIPQHIVANFIRDFY